MNPKTHYHGLMLGFFVAMGFSILAILLGSLLESSPALITWLACGWLFVLPALGLLWICLAPVCCDHCQERMAHGWKWERAMFRWRLIYTCKACGDVFVSGFTIGLGDGSW